MRIRRRHFQRLGAGGAAWLWAPSGPASRVRADELEPPQVVLTRCTNGHGDGQFDIPIAVTVNPRGEILATDFRQTNSEARARLQRFDPQGQLLGSYELDPMPGGLAVDPQGLIYAAHMMRHNVNVYEPGGKLVKAFGKQGTAPGEFQQPGGIAFGRDGTL